MWARLIFKVILDIFRGVKAVFLKYYQIGARGEVGKIARIFDLVLENG